jgi:hypothetical protein
VATDPTAACDRRLAIGLAVVGVLAVSVAGVLVLGRVREPAAEPAIIVVDQRKDTLGATAPVAAEVGRATPPASTLGRRPSPPASRPSARRPNPTPPS